MACERCGGRSQGRFCRQCGREQRRAENADFAFSHAISKQFLGENPPHKCDICESIVEDGEELAKSCPHGANRGASQ